MQVRGRTQPGACVVSPHAWCVLGVCLPHHTGRVVCMHWNGLCCPTYDPAHNMPRQASRIESSPVQTICMQCNMHADSHVYKSQAISVCACTDRLADSQTDRQATLMKSCISKLIHRYMHAHTQHIKLKYKYLHFDTSSVSKTRCAVINLQSLS